MPRSVREPLLIWAYKGPRFRDNGVDLQDLSALVALRSVLIEFAKSVWRSEHANRVNLPAHFDESIQLKIYSIERGSAKFAVYATTPTPPPKSQQARQLHIPGIAVPAADGFQDYTPQLERAAAMVTDAVGALSRGEEPTFKIPSVPLIDMKRLVSPLGESDTFEIKLPYTRAKHLRSQPSLGAGQRPGKTKNQTKVANLIKVDFVARRRLNESVEKIKRERRESIDNAGLRDEETDIAFMGIVARADVQGLVSSPPEKQGKAVVLVDGAVIPVKFTPAQEEEVTRALHKRKTMRLKVLGRGFIDPESHKPYRVTSVSRLECVELPLTGVQLAITYPQDIQRNGGVVSPSGADMLKADFDRLAERWIRDTRLMSSLTKIVEDPSYRAIIALGTPVLPYILRDLEREPKHWGPALQAITGAQPVPKEDAGKIRRVAAAWLDWARQHGYRW